MVRFLQEVYCIGLDPESAMDRYARKEPGYHDQDYKAFWRVLRSKLPCKHLEEDLD